MMQSVKIHVLLTISALLFLFFNNCNTPEHEPEKTNSMDTFTEVKPEIGKVINLITRSTGYPFSIYIPNNSGENSSLPTLLFFDAHKRSQLPLDLYSQLSEKYHVILVASGDAENGMALEEYRKRGDAIFNEIKNITSVNDSVLFVAGFSGGARVAQDYAIYNPKIKGLIMNSAGFPKDQFVSRPDLSIVGLGGSFDFNLAEMYQSFESVFGNKNHPPALFLMFNGKHDWAPEANMELALDFLISGLNKTRMNINKEADEDFARITNDMKEVFSEEIKFRNIYAEGLLKNRDTSYWKNEVTRIQNLAKTKGMEYEAMVKRLMGYMSIYCYSSIKMAIGAAQYNNAMDYVAIYRTVDSSNSEWAYLGAVIYANLNKLNKSLEFLNDAAALGFNDYERLINQKDFATFSSDPSFKKIVLQVQKNNAP